VGSGWLYRVSVDDLPLGARRGSAVAAIETYLEANNDNPKPYVWTATAEDILATVQRARTKLDELVNQD
jgi:hypothetical protein